MSVNDCRKLASLTPRSVKSTHFVMNNEATRFVTPQEAGRLLDVKSRTISRWIKDGKLRAVRLPSGRYKIAQEDVDAILATRGGAA